MKKVLYILGQLEDSDLQWMLGAGALLRVPAGEAIIHERQALDRLFIVVDGELKVSLMAQEQELANLGVGELVGEMSLLDSRPPNATVAATRDSQVFAIPHAAVHQKLERDPGFAARFYRALCVFLANRLNRTSAMIGRGRGPTLQEDVSEEDEISPEALDLVALAGARFDWFLNQLRNR